MGREAAKAQKCPSEKRVQWRGTPSDLICDLPFWIIYSTKQELQTEDAAKDARKVGFISFENLHSLKPAPNQLTLATGPEPSSKRGK
jgi:hypothetical protein